METIELIIQLGKIVGGIIGGLIVVYFLWRIDKRLQKMWDKYGRF